MGVERGKGPRRVYLNGIYFSSLKEASQQSFEITGKFLELWEIWRLLEGKIEPIKGIRVSETPDPVAEKKATGRKQKAAEHGSTAKAAGSGGLSEPGSPEPPKRRRALLVHYQPLEMGISPRYIG
ncbi:hypothetical protein FACS189479_05530 [Spirochaetia bacterium]|nr:hypothetical protein FACS189479_05530 [Spirochaetia bacterium]